jgi:hypothetical protein
MWNEGSNYLESMLRQPFIKELEQKMLSKPW